MPWFQQKQQEVQGPGLGKEAKNEAGIRDVYRDVQTNFRTGDPGELDQVLRGQSQLWMGKVVSKSEGEDFLPAILMHHPSFVCESPKLYCWSAA